MIFSYDFQIGLDEVNVDGSLKDKAILRYLENIACFHTDYVNGGVDNVQKSKRGWALLEWQVKILKRPEYGEKLSINTWGRRFTRTCVYRDYIIYIDGEPVILATSKWFILDLEKRMPVRIDREIVLPYESEEQSALGIDEIEKLSEQESYDKTFKTTVRKADIDMLGHLHNTNYLEMLYEELDDEDILNITNIRVSYKKEIALGTPVDISYCKKGGTIYSAFKTNDGTVLNALIELS